MFEMFISIVSGLLAGVGTGFAGLSAAVFIAPMLMIFAGVDSYSAVGIALASDVLASSASAVTYKMNGNIDLKRGRTLIITVLFFTVAGSVASHFFTGMDTGENIMTFWLPAATMVLGLKLLIWPSTKKRTGVSFGGRLSPDRIEFFCGIYIGFICGFQGTGGGMLLLFVLNILIGYEFHTAVGTSVWIMSFTALIGAISHFMIRELPDLSILLTCMITTLLGAQVASVIANKIEPVILKRITGGLMCASVIMMFLSVL